MTLIEQTYTELRAAELVATRVQFSRQYVGKNPNWYSYQLHMGTTMLHNLVPQTKDSNGIRTTNHEANSKVDCNHSTNASVCNQ